MKTTSRVSLIIPSLALVALVLPVIAFGAAAVDNVTPIAQSILATVQVLVTIVFTLSIVAFGWGIVRLIFAAGDPAAAAKAKQFLLWGVIGMAVMASIFGIISFLRSYFGVSDSQSLIKKPEVL